jgi:pimeloyl-ACP methyl ester carboxylesterase
MQKFELKNRHGLKIIGVLEKPDDNIGGTCIVMHGWGGNRNKSTVQAAKQGFLEAGFQTFNFDATHSFGESEGNFEQSTLTTFWEDLEHVVKWAQLQEWFVGPLALTGHSKGGYAVARYAEEHGKEVAYLVPIAPVVSGKLSYEAFKERDPEGLKEWERTGILIREGSEGDKKIQRWSQMTERLNHDLLLNASKITMPVLFIVGSEDTSCPPKHIKLLLDLIPEGNKKMEIIHGAPHSFHKIEEREICKEIIKDWLNKM